jgi:hypothetical protein
MIDQIYKRNSKFFIVFSHSPQSEVEISCDNFNFLFDQYSRVNSKRMLYISVVNSLILDICILELPVYIFFIVNDCLLLEDVIVHYIDLSKVIIYIIFDPKTSKYRIYRPNQTSFEDCSAEYLSKINDCSIFIEDGIKEGDFTSAFKMITVQPALVRILSSTKKKVSISVIDEKTYYRYNVQFLLKQCRFRVSQIYYSHTYYYFEVSEISNAYTGKAIAEFLETEHYVFKRLSKVKYDKYILNYFLLEKNVKQADFAIGLHKKNLLQLVALKRFPRNINFDSKSLYDDSDLALAENKKLVNEKPSAWLLVRIQKDLYHLNYLTHPFLVFNALCHYKTLDYFFKQSHNLIMKQVLTSIRPRVVDKQLLFKDLNELFLELDRYKYFIVSYRNPHDHLTRKEVESYMEETKYKYTAETVKDLLVMMKEGYIEVPGVKKKKP